MRNGRIDMASYLEETQHRSVIPLSEGRSGTNSNELLFEFRTYGRSLGIHTIHVREIGKAPSQCHVVPHHDRSTRKHESLRRMDLTAVRHDRA
jgi:hypothetical protein